MAKEKTMSTGSFWQELFQFGLYKRTQGRVTRQVTCVAIWIIVAFGSYRLFQTLEFMDGAKYWSIDGQNFRYGICGLVLAVGLYVGYRVVNYSKFADFLIAVEAEMNKVSWPSRTELVRSSIVVIVVMFTLATVLAGFDIIWLKFFQVLGIRQ